MFRSTLLAIAATHQVDASMFESRLCIWDILDVMRLIRKAPSPPSPHWLWSRRPYRPWWPEQPSALPILRDASRVCRLQAGEACLAQSPCAGWIGPYPRS